MTPSFASTKPNSAIPPTSLLDCLSDIKIWFASNFLKLHNDKTKVLLVATKSTLAKLDNITLTIDGSIVSHSAQVKSLGIILDSTFVFQTTDL